MFTGGAILLMILLALYAQRANERDRSSYERGPIDDRMWILLLHVRQDLKLAALLLAGTIVMLGIIADKLR